MPRRATALLLAAALLLSSLGPECPRALAAAVGPSGPAFETAPAAWADAAAAFGRWSAAAGDALTSIDPSLAGVGALSPAAVEPLMRLALAGEPTDEARASLLDRIARVAALAPDEQARVASTLAAARGAAARELEPRFAELAAGVRSGDVDLDAATRSAADWRGFSFYGPAAAARAEEASRAVAERRTARVVESAERLHADLTGRAMDPAVAAMLRDGRFDALVGRASGRHREGLRAETRDGGLAYSRHASAAALGNGDALGRMADLLPSLSDVQLESAERHAARYLARLTTLAEARQAAPAAAGFAGVRERLAAGDVVAAHAALARMGPVEIAASWDDLTSQERRIVFRLLPRRRAGQVFEELEPEQQQELVESLQHEHVTELLKGMDPAAVGRVARDLPPKMVERLLAVMEEGSRRTVERHLEYPPRTVGALMRSRFAAIEPQWTARRALEHVRLSTRLRHVDDTHLDTLLVVDHEGKLRGTLRLKALVVAPSDMRVSEVMDAAAVSLSPAMTQEEAVQVFAAQKLSAAPVVEDGKPVGLVTQAEILAATKTENEEDIAKMAGLETGLLLKSPLQITGARMPWLIATALGELVVSAIVKHYEPTLAHVVALATFIPLISAMGGNVGAQTATVVVRGLATGEVKALGAAKTVTKEIAVGLLLGSAYGLFIGFSAWLLYGGRYGLRFPLIVGSAMMASMTTAATAGSLEPFLFKKMGIDPATATGPLITTFTDLVSTIVYFVLAAHFL